MITTRQINKFLLFFSIIICSVSCYKNVKGCLDPFSSNYTAYSDEECLDCCEYPDITLQISYSLGNSGYSPARFTSNGRNDSFFIINAGLYFHDFELNSANSTLGVIEEISLLNMDGAESKVIDDFVKISPVEGTSFPLGSHQFRDSIFSVGFSLGLPTTFNQLDSAAIPVASDLSQVDNLLENNSRGYLTAFMDVYYDTIAKDTMRYQVPILDLSQEYLFNTAFFVDYGEDISLGLNVDLLKWTEGIDFASDGLDTAAIKLKFVQNIPNSISLD